MSKLRNMPGERGLAPFALEHKMLWGGYMWVYVCCREEGGYHLHVEFVLNTFSFKTKDVREDTFKSHCVAKWWVQ